MNYLRGEQIALYNPTASSDPHDLSDVKNPLIENVELQYYGAWVDQDGWCFYSGYYDENPFAWWEA